MINALAVTTHQHGRSLSYTQILSYPTGSQVTDHANIDLDQAALETELGSLPSGYVGAQNIYTTGAHSKPTAICTLVSPSTLGQEVARRASVTFTSNNGDSTAGSAYSAYAATATSIRFTYPVSESRVQPASTACYVGALDASAQSTLGCIAVPGGSGATATTNVFTIGSTTYQATCTNRGMRTLQGFSTKAQGVMHDCPRNADLPYENGCPYTSYLPYYNYYGDYSYADTIVTAALTGTAITGFTNGGMDMTNVADAARKELIKKGTAYMNTWMYVIREFEDAIDDCTAGDLTSNALSSGPVHAWDEGVAFYVGSLLTPDDMLAGNLPTLSSRGKLAYTLANKRCSNFVTCGPNGDSRLGEAKVNIELFDLFRTGQYQLLSGQCAAVVPIKNQIVQRMTVPLIQGTLRYAYKMAALSGSDKEKGEGAIFAAAVLPQLHACDPAAATAVYDNMNINHNLGNNVDFTAVKNAFEQCYPQMGVTCSDVGGLWNSATSAYYADAGFDASPCVDANSLPAGTAAAIAVAVGVFALCALCVLYMTCKERAGKPLFTELKKNGVATSA
jgi:hypothetical protein